LLKLEQYDPRRPFGPWLLRIVANAATDRRRRRTVRRVEPLDPGLVAGGVRPDRTAERRALAQRLREALAELPERRRVALVLFDVEGYSHAEIADVLGIPEGTVRSEVFHARRRLRAQPPPRVEHFGAHRAFGNPERSEEHTSELQSR